MHLHDWGQIENEQLSPSASRQVLHTETMTVARLTLKEGAVVPRHSHMNEQVTMMERGRLRFIFDDHEQIVEAGQVMYIPAHVPHGVVALTECLAVDLFS